METNTTRLTAADLENLDIEELLRNIFASDVDLKKILKKGLNQIQQTESLVHAATKAEIKAEKKFENADVNAAAIKVAANGTLAVTAAVAAWKLSNPWGWGLLAVAAAVRTVKYTADLQQCKRERDAYRRGDVIVVTEAEALEHIASDARFETLIGLADTAIMTQIGMAGGGAYWLAAAALQGLATGYSGAIWSGSKQVLAQKRDEVVDLPAAFRKPGAHKRAVRLVTNA